MYMRTPLHGRRLRQSFDEYARVVQVERNTGRKKKWIERENEKENKRGQIINREQKKSRAK
jgi:hypothetical protein